MMKTITFYSYKGGVGRTMALINVAWRLAKRGKRIGVLDMDLEAPGMSLLAELGCSADKGWQGKGLLAYLRTPREALARLAETANDERSGLSSFARRIRDKEFTEPGEIIFLPCVGEDHVNQGRESLELAEYIDEALRPRQQDEKPPRQVDDGAIRPRPEDEQPKAEADPARLLEVQDRFARLGCEYLLVDSRTGLCATSGLATMTYPQQVVVLLGLNRQNLEGTRDALRQFRSEPAARDIDFLILPSLLPSGEEQAKEQAFDRIAEMAAEAGLDKEKLLLSLSLPYHPQLATEDRPMLVSGRANFLAERYDQLAAYLIARNAEDPLTRIVRARELLREAKSTDDKDVRRGRAMRALREIGHLPARAPFAGEAGFQKLYGEICFRAGCGVEARLALLKAMSIESAVNDGKPTIKTALLFHELLRERGTPCPERIAWLQKVRTERFRAEDGDDDWNALYSALSSELRINPPDVDGLIALNSEIAVEIPSFAPAATGLIAEAYAVHGLWDESVATFTEAERHLRASFEQGKVEKHVVATLYDTWARLCVAVRRFGEAEDCLRKAEEWYEGDSLIQNHLDLADVIGKAREEGTKAQIAYLESVLPRDELSAQAGQLTCSQTDRLIERLASLYEDDERLEDALRCRTQLFHLRPWDQRDAILRIRRLQEKLGRGFDQEHEAVARAWVERWPDDYFSVMTLAELLLLRGAVGEAAQMFLDGARSSLANADLLARAMRNYATERWRQAETVDAFITALQDPVFAQSDSSRLALSLLHRVRGQWPQALDATLDAARLSPTTAERLDRLDDALEIMERLGRWSEAQDLVEQEFREHWEDVNWPHMAANFYLRYAVQRQGAVRTQLLEKALAILADLEARTGAMQLDRILPLRYHILVACLGRIGEAEADLERVRHEKYEARRDEAMKAVPDADRVRFLSARDWKKALDQTSEMSRYAHSTERWRRMLELQAGLQFFLGTCHLRPNGQQEAYDTLGFLEEADIEQDIDLQELKMRCCEALGQHEEAAPLLRRLWNQLKSTEVQDQALSVLSLMVRIALRQPDAVEKAKDAVTWIDIKDMNLWLAEAQSAAALYHCCFGDKARAEELLMRLGQIGYYHDWLGDFLHDLQRIAAVHHLAVDLPTIRQRYQVC